MVRGNHTNNYAEAGIKILKELVFARIKAFNLIEMISFVVNVMELYYQCRLIHLANNRIDRFIGLRFCGIKSSSVPAEASNKAKTIFFMSIVGKSVDWFMLLTCTWGYAVVEVE